LVTSSDCIGWFADLVSTPTPGGDGTPLVIFLVSRAGAARGLKTHAQPSVLVPKPRDRVGIRPTLARKALISDFCSDMRIGFTPGAVERQWADRLEFEIDVELETG